MDPFKLSRKEHATSVRLAGEHRKMKTLAKGRTRAVLVRPLGSDRRQAAGRRSLVGMYDYSADRSVVAVVDLESEKIVSVEETPLQFQLAPEERKEAEGLAAKDDRVKEFLGGRKMNPLTRLYFPSSGPERERKHRFAIVFLRPTNSERRYAVVDLSAQRVTDVLSPSDMMPQ